MRIGIIGGGISGLATAFYLQQARPEWQLRLFEKEARAGGTMQTVERDGFRFEAGGNGFLTNKPDSLELVHAVGADGLLQPSSDAARKRYLYTDRLHRLPESPPAFLKTPLLTLPEKLRVAAEVFVPPRRDLDDESLQSFGERRVGRAFTDVFLNAMVAGIYAATPAQTSVRAAFPLVWNLEREYGGLFRGMLKKRRKEAGPGGTLTSFRDGVGSFIDHLANRLDVALETGAEVTGVERDGRIYRLITPAGDHEVDRVVVATPAYAAAELLNPVDTELAALLEGIAYAPIAVVGLGYDRLDHPLDGFGLLAPESAGLEILGILWDSSIFPGRAPAGGKVLRVMIGGLRQPALALRGEDELVRIALAGVERTMGCRNDPLKTFVRRWERGIPNYAVGHLATVDAAFARLRDLPGLYLNSNAYYGISMNDCVANSRKTAAHITVSWAETDGNSSPVSSPMH